jgi:hypothetical protein
LTDAEIAKVEAYAGTATTEELLDRITIFRADHDPEALLRYDRELRHRGIGHAEIERHGETRAESAIVRKDGSVARCEFCERPAEVSAWKWHRLWGKVPMFPRPMALCERHRDGRD